MIAGELEGPKNWTIAGLFEVERETGPSNPSRLLSDSVEVPVVPAAIVTGFGLAVRLKSGTGTLMPIKDVWDMEPLDPLMATEYVPAGVDAGTDRVRTELLEPPDATETADGLKDVMMPVEV